MPISAEDIHLKYICIYKIKEQNKRNMVFFLSTSSSLNIITKEKKQKKLAHKIILFCGKKSLEVEIRFCFFFQYRKTNR